jgi:di/tricarboxylate transporter
VIVMVCGVSVLTALLDKTGGTQRFAELIDTVSTPGTVTAVLAFATGLVSIYSSTTGVVLPAFLPMVKHLAELQAGSEPLALATAVVIGGNLVDVSPLSTIGALCLASAPAGAERRVLFLQLLAWGLAMSLVGAVLCWALFLI